MDGVINMASVDWNALESKINKWLNSSEGKKVVQETVDKIMLGKISFKVGDDVDTKTPKEAAEKFIQVLTNTIYTHGLSSGVSEAIAKGIVCSSPFKNGNVYSINVYWQSDLSRPSLNGVDELHDLAELYDTGVDHTMNRIWGTWHGKTVGSKTDIPGNHFMDEAVRAFIDGYGNEYGVKDITIRRED